VALIDLYISNDRHHAAMMHPVAKALRSHTDLGVRVVSLCEFRGMRSPEARFRDAGVGLVRIMDGPRRIEGPSGRARTGAVGRMLRTVVRRAAWHVSLSRRVEACLRQAPRLAVLPNDAAFPYDRIVDLLRARGIPFVLLQEGIRFPLPDAEKGRPYGGGGAAAVAAWGEASAGYFRQAGVDESHLVLTGSPRFDALGDTDWSAAAAELRGRLGLRGRCLLFLSNPIDDLGFCSTREKLELIARFVAGVQGMLGSGRATLLVKLHGSESARAVERALAPLGLGDRVRVVVGEALYPLLALADAAVVLASTVGLEALILGRPIGVLEVPGAGWVHDYVSAGAGMALSAGGALGGQVDALMSTWKRSSAGAVERYLAHHLAERQNATARVVDVIRSVADGH
jgi:hypothetical protein